MRTHNLLTAAALGAGIWLIPATAAASCAQFPPLEEHLARADVVFVGTVVSVTDEQRTALVQVEEIWRGSQLPAEVTVHGGFDPGAFTSVDRGFEAGARYLFAPSIAEGRLQDSSCSATQLWSDELADLRPATVATPPPDSGAEDGSRGGVPMPLVVAGIALVLVAGLSVIAFRVRCP